MAEEITKKPSLLNNLIRKVTDLAQYLWYGVWKDKRDNLGIRILKVINLSIRSFMDRGLQNRSMSLTYTTVLAIVPAFALLFAIARGFGFQNIIHDELFTFLPSQQKALETALTFVESYLQNASQGVFVGIGLVVLLWTVISLLSNVEEAFNQMWDISESRSMVQKFSDYLSICLIVPVLMVCSSGVSIFVSTAMQDQLHLKFLTPLINILIDLIPFILLWGACAFSFAMVPNTKVNFKYAAISAAVTCVALQLLQFLFVTGQIYVSKYNAIYGTFAFLPLLLVWLQLSWLIVLSGCMLTYCMQNVFSFNYTSESDNISQSYFRKVTIIVAAVIYARQAKGLAPLSMHAISEIYDLPTKLVNRVIDKLVAAGLLYKVEQKHNKFAYAPSQDTHTFTVENLLENIDKVGSSQFIPQFQTRFSSALKAISELYEKTLANADKLVLAELPVPIIEQNESKTPQ